MGETCDARRAIPNWAKPGFDDSGWATVDTGAVGAALCGCPSGGAHAGVPLQPVVEPHPGPAVIAIQEFRPRRITQPKKTRGVVSRNAPPR